MMEKEGIRIRFLLGECKEIAPVGQEGDHNICSISLYYRAALIVRDLFIQDGFYRVQQFK